MKNGVNLFCGVLVECEFITLFGVTGGGGARNEEEDEEEEALAAEPDPALELAFALALALALVVDVCDCDCDCDGCEDCSIEDCSIEGSGLFITLGVFERYGLAGDGEVAKYINKSAPSASL